MALSSERKFIKKLTRQKIEEQVRAFGGKHYGDTDEELLEYLRQCAAELGGTVFNGNGIYTYDIVGTKLLKERFGNNWDDILAKAGLPKISPQERPIKVGLYCRETRRIEWCLDKTREALAERERKFMEKYAQAADEEILTYLREAAERLGHTPAGADIAGRKFICERFGSWADAIKQAGLPKVKRKYAKPEDGLLFREEFRRQEAVYAENQRRLVSGETADVSVIATDEAIKKMEKNALLLERARKWAKRTLLFKEKLFTTEYAGAKDKLLLAYLNECGRELGRLPHKSEVIGGEYLERRFGGWNEALRKAGCTGRAAPEPETTERLIYTREVQIQKYLLEGRETVVRTLYKSQLICRMQAGNAYHLLRWNPAARNGADSQCYSLLIEELKENGLDRPMTQTEMEAEAAKIKAIYNRTLDFLDLQTRRFELEYRNAGKNELLEYVRGRAEELHTTPQMLDVVGAEFIMQQLHCTWGMVLSKLHMKRNGPKRKVYQCLLFKKEFNRQRRIWEREHQAEPTVDGVGEAV